MKIRWIATIVIAALLMTGAAAAVVVASEQGAQLTAAEAQNAALTHAGLTAEQVTGLRSSYDWDDGVPEWDIEFRSGDWEYDYTVNANTGAIRDWDKEYDPQRTKDPTPTEPAVTQPAPIEPTPTQPPVTEPAASELTADQAESIALAHAGVTAEQVRGLRCEYDVDRGVAQWEVDFEVDGWEYEYEIEAATGRILRSEKDWDD